jgi:MFS transporter, FHS family, L-fucose permease
MDRQTPMSSAVWLPSGVIRSFVLVCGLFFLWGIPNNLNDLLIRQFMKSFEISRFQAGLVQSAFYLGYFLLALPAGLLMKRHGYKSGFLTGLILFATGCFLFLPAANSGRYGFFLAALFVMASGLSFLETASNPFVAQLGPTATSEQRLNLAQAFNPLGCITGILAGTAFIFSGVELSQTQVSAMQAAGTYAAYLHSETMRVVAPYLVPGSLALLWAFTIGATRFPAFLQAREMRRKRAETGERCCGSSIFYSPSSHSFYTSALRCASGVISSRIAKSTPILRIAWPVFFWPALWVCSQSGGSPLQR